MLSEVYINRIAKFLPNEPISNEEMEQYLGLIHGQPSRAKHIVLRNNGIKKRYYALDKIGRPTHSNAQMVANAIQKLFEGDEGDFNEVDLLSCGTSTPDQLIPSHGVMVHGHLNTAHGMEVVSLSGVCCSGMHALKYAWMSVKSGSAQKAIATGSERVSRIIRADMFEEEAEKLIEADKNPYITFDKEFLRWMLSDGAGAFLLDNKKNEIGISLKIEWLEGISFAHLIEACMYSGAEKCKDGSLKGYMDYSAEEIKGNSILSIKQDVKILSGNIVSLGIEHMKELLNKRGLKVNDIDYFLPHISSEFFRDKLAAALNEIGIGIPQEKWFTNLSQVGNVGAASIYLMLEELMNNNTLRVGQKIFVSVPESARFSYTYALLTVC